MNGFNDWFLGWILARIKSRSPSDYKTMQEFYRERIDFMKAELEEQKLVIESFRDKHKGNGRELEKWDDQITKLNQEKINMMGEIRSLKTQLLFCLKLKNVDANSKVKDGPN